MSELESGKPVAQIAREYGIHPGLPSQWHDELAENPEMAFSGNGNKYKDKARIELERLLGQAHAKNELPPADMDLRDQIQEEEIQAGYYRFQSWIASISQPSKERPDLWAKSGMGFGYHLCLADT